MKALIVKNSKLEIQEIDKPKLKENEVLIKTKAIGINRADILQKKGFYPPPADASNVLGIELSGTIVEVHNNLDKDLIKKKVLALVTGGAYAEYVIANVNCLLKLPKTISLEDGAAIPEAFLVAYLNLFKEAKLKSTETVYINAGASGVGIAAIQLAKVSGAKVISSAGSKEKKSYLDNLGVDLSINYKLNSIKEVIEKEIGRYSVDVMLDMVAGPNFNDHLSILSDSGRLILIGYQAGRKVDIDLAKLLIKKLSIKGSTLRSRSIEFKKKLINDFEKDFFEKFNSKEISPIIAKKFSFQDADKAHDFMENNKNIGKILLVL